MAKCIKRAGIVFFAIVLSLLLFIGIILTLNATNSNDNFSDLKNDEIQTVADKYYDLSGDTFSKADIWNEAVAYSVDNKKSVELKLLSDWTPSYMGDAGYQFGYGRGFTSLYGGIYVPTGASITLRLNGYSIIGNVMYEAFVIDGTLTIYGSNNSNFKKEILTGNITGSKITGFQMQSSAPLIRLSNTRTFYSWVYMTIINIA